MMDYKLIQSNRKTISISITKELCVLVKAPFRMKKSDIDLFVAKHKIWCEKHIEIQKRKNDNEVVLSKNEIKALKIKAAEIITEKVHYFSKVMGVTPTDVKITSAKTRWGSCSPKNSLCFSYKTVLLSDELIDCIVVHELAHIKIKNHSNKFYAEVLKYIPDYKQKIKGLKTYIE